MFSGGLGSWATAKRVAEKHGTEDLILLFADVKGDNPSPHAGEDADAYRFIAEAAANVFGVTYDPTATPRDFADRQLPGLVWLNEGRDIWQVFHDDRFLGNSRLANCSKFLKQRPCRAWLDAHCDPLTTVVYVGIDWTESARLAAIEKAYLPYTAKAPMTEAPFMDRDAVRDLCTAEGIKIPRLYKAGFAHNNCGGFCVRSGHAQFAALLREHPARYAYHEAHEQDLREYLDKDVAIMRDRTGGTVTPLTMRGFRERIEAAPQAFDEFDIGGCGCFVDEPA